MKMNDFLLFFDASIPQLEKQNRWATASRVVFQKWKDNPDNLNYLICAGTQLWYTLLVTDYYKNAPTVPENIELPDKFWLQDRLMEVTRYGFEVFENHAAFNAYFGYMIKAMPYFFLNHEYDYVGWQSKGVIMMRRSYDIAPNSPFTKAMCLEQDSSCLGSAFYLACMEIWSAISPEQWGKTAVQQYFFRVLYGDLFYPDYYS